MTDHMHVDDPAVAAVLAAAAAPAEGPVPGEAEALAMFRSVHQPRRQLRMSRFSDKAKLIAAAVFGGVVVISGAATAATGSIPLVSHGHGHSHSHPAPASTHTPDANDDQESTDTSTPDGTDATPDTKPTDNHGSDVSKAAHDAPQGHKGPAVCIVASNNKCKAGESHGQADSSSGGNSATHRKNTATTHSNAHTNTGGNSATHRKNTATTHSNSGVANGHAHAGS